MLNQQSILDVTKLMTGKDRQLFVTQKDGTGVFSRSRYFYCSIITE
ncbi:MAG: hypothetical protein HFE58_08315 [Firmicutes bacterium]|jgi:hypothetical protein|nr:hypothetical protein [Bacillota bacterium]